MRSKLTGLIHSFQFAASGVKHCVQGERNFRIHLIATAYVILLAAFLKLAPSDFGVLVLTVSNVLVMEMLNTAVEALVDLVSPQRQPLAKVAKDVAAGAVLVSAAASVAVGVLLLWQPDKLIDLILAVLTTPSLFIALTALLALSIWFIFKGGAKSASRLQGENDNHDKENYEL